MSDIFDMLRDFTNFTGKIERDIHDAASRINLPDEIDLYNFFEKYKGVAKGVMDDKSYSKLCGYHAYYMTKSFETRSLSEYLSIYEDTVTINYYIGNNRYYAIKFKKRGVFLVSEKRYNELKAYK